MKSRILKIMNALLGPLRLQVHPTRLDSQLIWKDLFAKDVLAPSIGQITIEEGRALGQLASRLKCDGPIVEIGTLFGWSTRVLSLFKSPERRLISVDNYAWNPLQLSPEQHSLVTRSALEEVCEKHNVQLVCMGKSDFYRQYAGPTPSMVFIDAGHSYDAVLEDIKWAMSVGAEVICGHDYDASAWPGVVQAVEEMGGISELTGTLWVLSK